MQDTYDLPLYMTIFASKLELNGISCEMEIDTGCSLSLVSPKQFYELPNSKLSKKLVIQKLRTYSGEVIIPKGVANLNIKNTKEIFTI